MIIAIVFFNKNCPIRKPASMQTGGTKHIFRSAFALNLNRTKETPATQKVSGNETRISGKKEIAAPKGMRNAMKILQSLSRAFTSRGSLSKSFLSRSASFLSMRILKGRLFFLKSKP